jgi:hypothetical protein
MILITSSVAVSALWAAAVPVELIAAKLEPGDDAGMRCNLSTGLRGRSIRGGDVKRLRK